MADDQRSQGEGQVGVTMRKIVVGTTPPACLILPASAFVRSRSHASKMAHSHDPEHAPRLPKGRVPPTERDTSARLHMPDVGAAEARRGGSRSAGRRR